MFCVWETETGRPVQKRCDSLNISMLDIQVPPSLMVSDSLGRKIRGGSKGRNYSFNFKWLQKHICIPFLLWNQPNTTKRIRNKKNVIFVETRHLLDHSTCRKMAKCTRIGWRWWGHHDKPSFSAWLGQKQQNSRVTQSGQRTLKGKAMTPCLEE